MARSTSTKGQAWYADFIIATVIFTVCLALFYRYVPSLNRQELTNLDEARLDAEMIANSLSTEGYPAGWSEATVERLGITDDGRRINATKVEMLNNLTGQAYQQSKELFSVRSDFVVFFTDTEDMPLAIAGIYHVGNASLDMGNRIDTVRIPGSSLTGLTRLLTFEERPVKMVVYAWN